MVLNSLDITKLLWIEQLKNRNIPVNEVYKANPGANSKTVVTVETNIFVYLYVLAIIPILKE